MIVPLRWLFPILGFGFPGLSVLLWLSARSATAHGGATPLLEGLQIALALALLALALLALWAGRHTAAQLRSVADSLARLGSGDLAGRIQDTGVLRELRSVGRSLNAVGAAQTALVREIHDAAGMLGSNSRIFVETCGKVADQAESMRSATNTVAAALEELSASSATVSAQSQQIDANARRIVETTNRLNRESFATSMAIGEQFLSLESFGQGLTQARDRLTELETSTDAITRFVDEILEVVSRTRLLALNATIEASRAGEAGRGFGVVASEVKELARKTATMAEGIQERIREIEDRTRNVASGLTDSFEGMGQLQRDARAAILSIEVQSALSLGADELAEEIVKGTTEVSRALAQSRTGIEEIERSAIDTEGRAVALNRGIGRIREQAIDLERGGRTLAGSIAHLKLGTPFMPWTGALSLGIDIIDEQHKVLVRLINHLHELVESETSPRAIAAVLGQLADYTKFHFADEEKYMASIGYPDRLEHAKVHVRFIAEVETLVARQASGQPVDGAALLARLRDWLTGHIMGTDRKYAEHLGGADHA